MKPDIERRDVEARAVPSEIETAIARRVDEAAGVVLAWGPVLEVYFPVAGARRDLQHGLGAVPTGYQLFLEVGGNVRGVDVSAWTPDLAYLVADADHTRARVAFQVTRDVVRVEER